MSQIIFGLILVITPCLVLLYCALIAASDYDDRNGYD